MTRKDTLFGLILTITSILLAAFIPKEVCGELTSQVQTLIMFGAPLGIIILTHGVAAEKGTAWGWLIFSRALLIIASIMAFQTMTGFSDFGWYEVLGKILMTSLIIFFGINNLRFQ